MPEDKDDRSWSMDVEGWGFRIKLDGCGCIVLALALSLAVGAFGGLWELLT